MGQLGRYLRRMPNGYAHWCPGCQELHAFAVDQPLSNGARWSFNGDIEKPTFSPSMNYVGHCHYTITAGMIQFHGDSVHALKGQTVPLPELPAHSRD